MLDLILVAFISNKLVVVWMGRLVPNPKRSWKKTEIRVIFEVLGQKNAINKL